MAIKTKHYKRFQNLGFAIAYRRKLKSISQAQLAEIVGVSRDHISAIEAPKKLQPMSFELFFDIANVLDIEPYLLLKFPGEEQPK